MPTTVHTRSIEAGTSLHESIKPPKVRLAQRQLRLIHRKIPTGKVWAQIPLQALRVVRHTSLRSHMHEISDTSKRSIRNTSTSCSSRNWGERVVRVALHERSVSAKARYRIEDGRGGELLSRCVKRPVPVWLSSFVTTLLAQHFLVHGNEEAVPCKEVADVVDGKGLLHVRVEQVVVSRDYAAMGELRGSGGFREDAFDGLDVVGFLFGFESSPAISY